ncbi:MAG: shikimate kinase [Candidatus Dormibacteraceae bacterium]
MGVGKSSLGRVLAVDLGLQFKDIDELVEARLGASIAEAFAAGEVQRFRDLEALVVGEVLAGEPAVLSLGGGSTVRDEVRAQLLERSLLVFLYVPWTELRDWIGAERGGRPLIEGLTLDQIGELYSERLPVYRQAHLEVRVPRSGTQASRDLVLAALKALPESRPRPAPGAGEGA